MVPRLGPPTVHQWSRSTTSRSTNGPAMHKFLELAMSTINVQGVSTYENKSLDERCLELLERCLQSDASRPQGRQLTGASGRLLPRLPRVGPRLLPRLGPRLLPRLGPRLLPRLPRLCQSFHQIILNKDQGPFVMTNSPAARTPGGRGPAAPPLNPPPDSWHDKRKHI